MALSRVAFTLWPYLRHSWRRKQERRGGWHGANTRLVMGLALLGAVGVLVTSVFAFKSLRSGATAGSLVLLQGCLNATLMGWLSVPILVGATTAEGRGLQPRRLGQFPLGLGDLLAIGMMGNLVQPVYWILAASSLCALLPLFVTAHPLPGVVAGLLYLLLSMALAWSVEIFGGALFSSRRGREILLVVALVLLAPALILINGDYSLIEGALTFSFAGHHWLLLSADGSAGLLAAARIFSPATWVVESAQGLGGGRGLGLLTLAGGAALAVAAASLRRVMLNPPATLSAGRGGARAMGSWRGLPRTWGTLVAKEVRYLSRTLDHLLAVGLSVGALVWIFVRPDQLRLVLPLAAVGIIYNESAIPLNVFGLDGAGADRYRLLPLSGRQVVLTKNLAYLLLVAGQLVPVLLAGLLKGGALLALVTVLGTGGVCLLTAAGGNLASIRSPAPRAFFNFDSKEQTGGALTLLLAALIWLIPAIVYFALLGFGLWVVAAGMAVFAGLAVPVYLVWLGRAGQAFEEAAESMRDRLSRE